MSETDITFDRCQICGYEAVSDEFIENKNRCPVCGSEDVDDASFDPYTDDDDEEELW